MKSTIETLEGNKVKLSIELEEAEFDREIDAAFRKIAKEIRLPGFRPGKAPRQVVEARIGKDAARTQAIQDAIPEYLSRAVREHDVDIIATPDVELKEGQEAGVVKFDATCEIRPVILLPGYAGLRAEVPAIEVPDQEIDDVLDAERRRLGKLETVDRAAKEGDFVIGDLVGSRDGEPVVGLAVEEWSYEIGKKWVAPSFDENLIGQVAGASFAFSDTPSGTQEAADFAVTLTSVQELVVPELSDAWVAENIEDFENVAEWRESVVDRLTTNRLNQVRNVVVEKVTDALIELADIETPEVMVAADLQRRVENTIRQFQNQGINIDQWLQATGQDAQSFVEGLRPQSQKAVKVDLALRAIVKAENLDATDEEVENEFESMADRSNEAAFREHQMAGSPKNKKIKFVNVDQIRAAYQANDAVVDLAAEISKSKALDWLIHRVEYVDPSGNVLDRDAVIGHSESDHQHDHDHDEDDHEHDENSSDTESTEHDH